MRRKRPRPRSLPPAGDERRIEALTVAMALAPGVYARNRMFELFSQPAMQRARARASTLRGIVRQLARAQAISVATEDPSRAPTGEPTFVLRYALAAVRLTRAVELTRAELAALRILASRAGAAALPPSDDDRGLVEAALARLIAPGEEARGLAEAAQDVATD